MAALRLGRFPTSCRFWDQLTPPKPGILMKRTKLDPDGPRTKSREKAKG